MGDVKCLNPWDVQSKHVMSVDGKCESICAGEKRWTGLSPNICYAVEGNVVDRVSAKNGKGWCEGVSPTLNTQDRHAVVYALEGNGARPSHQGCGYSDDGKMYTLNTIEQHAVCYDARGNGTGDIVSTLTGDHQNKQDYGLYGNCVRTRFNMQKRGNHGRYNFADADGACGNRRESAADSTDQE